MNGQLTTWIRDIGFPIVAALLLLGLVTKALPELASKVDAMNRALDIHYGQSTTSIYLLRQICLNEARDAASRDACLR